MEWRLGLNSSMPTDDNIVDCGGVALSLDELEFHRTIGVGSFGQVRLVTLKENPMGRAFALKSLKKIELIRHRLVERAESEKDILLMMDHPFIIRLLGTFQDQDYLYLALEYADGGDLFSRLEKENFLHEEHARFYTMEAALALEHLHSLGVAHRDFKPENILIDFKGHIKLADFGSAKIIEGYSFTQCGTPEYTAPEMILGQGHSLPVDLWALGVALFEMVVGHSPFVGEDLLVIYQKILSVQIASPEQALGADVAHLTTDLLQYDPASRYGFRHAGAKDIKGHKWFSDTNWAAVECRELEPPFVPVVI